MGPPQKGAKRELEGDELTVFLLPLCKLEPLPCFHLKKISYDWVTTRPWRYLSKWAGDEANCIKYDKAKKDADGECSMILNSQPKLE